MKKMGLIGLCAALVAIPAYAEAMAERQASESPALADKEKEIDFASLGHGKEACDKLTELTGGKHYYGEGQLKSYAEIVPLSGFPPVQSPNQPDDRKSKPVDTNKSQQPHSYSGIIVLPEKGEVNIRLSGAWVNPEASLNKLKMKPFPMEKSKSYGFCYQPVKSDSLEYMWIAYPQTIISIKE